MNEVTILLSVGTISLVFRAAYLQFRFFHGLVEEYTDVRPLAMVSAIVLIIVLTYTYFPH